MALLGDFLMGLARTVPGVIDGIEDRQEKERKRQELEAERKRQEMLAEQIYARNRADKIADTDEARAYDQRLRDEAENLKAIERARAAAEREDAIAAAVGGQYGLSGDEVKRTAKTGLLQRTVEDESGGHTVNDDARAEKVIKRFNTALGRVKAGDSPANVFKEFREEDEDESTANMTPEQLAAHARRRRVKDGRNLALDDEQLAEARARTAAAQALADQRNAKTNAPPAAAAAPKPEGPTKSDLVAAAKVDQDVAKQELKDAQEQLSKAVRREDKDRAQQAVDAAKAALTEATNRHKQVLLTGKLPDGDEAGPKLQPPAAAPTAAPAAAPKKGSGTRESPAEPANEAEYRALPAGAFYKKDGKIYKKGG